jgi:pimeloyl-ACP methyl ester carboxylesterase
MSSTRNEGSGPTLLLIHGYPFNSWDWAPIRDRLTERFTLVAPDMLGMGFSDMPTKYEYTVHDHADMHEALLAHLGHGSAHILAHDLGDSVGQEMLARHEFGEQAYGALRIDSIVVRAADQTDATDARPVSRDPRVQRRKTRDA